MPAAGANGGGQQRGWRPPPQPVPKAPPPAVASIPGVSRIFSTPAPVRAAPSPVASIPGVSRAVSVAQSTRPSQPSPAAQIPGLSRVFSMMGLPSVSRGLTDIQGSRGGDPYGLKQADAFKQTGQYRNAVTGVFDKQSSDVQKLLVKNALADPTKPESKIVLDHVKSVPDLKSGTLSEKAVRTGSGLSVGGILGSGTIGPGGSMLPIRAGIDTARAIVEQPSLIPTTLKGGADLAAGMVAAPVDLLLHPGKIPKIPGQIVSDLANRYGPLVTGNDRAFIDQLKQNPEGAAPYLVDALTAAGGLDATLGRATATAAKKAGAKWATTERPSLLLSGNKTRPQQLGSTAGRIAAQRVEDRLRAAKASRAPGELVPGLGQVAPVFTSHAIRVTHSQIAQTARRTIQENLNREVRQGAARAGGKLSPLQQRFAFLGIEGTVPLTSGAAAAREAIGRRMQQIEAHRTNPASLGNHIAPQHMAAVDELALLREAHQKAEQIFTPKFAAWQKGEVARAQRIEQATALHPATAEARRLRTQGELLGITHPDVARVAAEKAASNAARVAQADARTAPRASSGPSPSRPAGAGFGSALAAQRAKMSAASSAEQARPQLLAQYNEQVRAAARNAGLPEPGFFHHQPTPRTNFGAYASGSGAQAMRADKQSQFSLYHAGVLDRSYQTYLDGLAQSIKRPYQWKLTNDQFHAAAIPTPSRTAIFAALSRHVQPASLTGFELRHVLEHSGIDLKNVRFMNPGRLAESTLAAHDLLPKGKMLTEAHQLQASHDLHSALQQHDVSLDPTNRQTERYLASPGFKAIPKTAHDEITGGLKGSSLGGRLVGKVQGTTAGVILGMSPSFLVMNSLAHVIPALAATKGTGIASMIKFPLWWHGLSDAQRDIVRSHAGGRGGHYAMTAKLGSTAPTKIAASWRQLQQRGIVQKATVLNPFHAVLKAEDLQSNFFRHAVFYHELKRQAFQNMGHEYGQGVRLMEQLHHAFTLGPQERMQALLHDMPTVEALGRTTINILGDYGRFTNRERQFMNNRAVLFYSFLRHVTRTLFYVLPARHPLALGLLGELAQLHNDEVRKMLGGVDLPWAYSRVYFDHNGHLSSIDMARTSPVTSPLVDVLSRGISATPRMLAPALQPLLDMAYGKTPEGGAVPQNVFSLMNSYLSLSYPYRAGSLAHFGLTAQLPDSVPFLHEDPRVIKSAAGQAYAAQKAQERGPLSSLMLAGALGVFPKPDDSRAVAAHRAAQDAKKAGAGGGSSGASGLGGFGGSSGGGGGSGLAGFGTAISPGHPGPWAPWPSPPGSHAADHFAPYPAVAAGSAYAARAAGAQLAETVAQLITGSPEASAGSTGWNSPPLHFAPQAYPSLQYWQQNQAPSNTLKGTLPNPAGRGSGDPTEIPNKEPFWNQHQSSTAATALSPGRPGQWAPWSSRSGTGPGNIPGVAAALGGVENAAFAPFPGRSNPAASQTAGDAAPFQIPGLDRALTGNLAAIMGAVKAEATAKAGNIPGVLASVPGVGTALSTVQQKSLVSQLKPPPEVRLSGAMAAVIALANSITANHYNYEWGGGHIQIGVPNSGTGHGSGPGTGYDCSGAISAILHAAGVQQAPMVAADYMSYGQPGAGTKPNDVTIYSSPDHVFSQIGGKYFGTSGSNPGGGAAWFSHADTSGFTVRHVTIPAKTPVTSQMIATATGAPAPAGQAASSSGQPLQNVPTTLGKLFTEAGKKYNIPPAVLAGVAQIETSMGTNRSTSSAGAQGLMQFMPGTAASHGVDPYNDRSSVLGAARLLNEFGYQSDPLRALGAYNGGPGNPQYGYAHQVMAAANGFGAGAANISAAAQTGSASGSAAAAPSSGSNSAASTPSAASAADPLAALTGATIPGLTQAQQQQMAAATIAANFLASNPGNVWDMGKAKIPGLSDRSLLGFLRQKAVTG